MVVSITFAQDSKKTLSQANNLYNNGNFYKAYTLYKQVYTTDSLNADLNFKMGVCLFNTRKEFASEKYFFKAKKSNFNAYFYLGRIAHLKENFNRALAYFQTYKLLKGEKLFKNEEADKYIDEIRFAKSLKETPVNVDLINLNSPINSEFHEYAPFITADGEELYFTARRPNKEKNNLDPNGEPYESIYYSKKVNNKWSYPKEMSNLINSNFNTATAGLSPDGQTLFIFKTNENLTGGDLYVSNMGLDSWETPYKLPPEINSEYVEASASITTNDKVLYFSSNRPGGYGGKDIYMVKALPNGEWGKAINLGPVVNTPFDEDSPFIHVDGKTLYFSSNGHPSMGGYDIFKTTLNDDGTWNIPENLGSPINSVSNDLFFIRSADNKEGYFSSQRLNGLGGQDIYKVLFNDEIYKVKVVHAKLFDKKTNEIIGGKITLMDMNNKKIHGIYKSSDKTGKFIMVINPITTYEIIIEAPGYEIYKKEFIYNTEEDITFYLDASDKKTKK